MLGGRFDALNFKEAKIYVKNYFRVVTWQIVSKSNLNFLPQIAVEGGEIIKYIALF